ncbi:TPA: hypothetical protein N2R15_002461 [Citrobacter amalonaticus]|uniref:SH3 domain-containing protein n=1 Tax=Citrobacter telavivensis TaxID=2653932 RepID=A0A6L5EHF9_9ENTR|nr:MULTISPECIES: SH3 domain-containing protein [Citrobacter]MPQ54095.1 hypothetical protein [Citrobacter telavivensis]QFS73574.1 hypothetical protein GBC03_26835 [Citrobacter telavivensis]CAI9395147.1 hypothetical protein CITSP_04822 [Citrobacter sp. T1.2D-1]HCL6627751.1 hypothetical protein [Citrobacter amalonaticus]
MDEKIFFIATGQHRSEYPDPITFTRGTPLIVGERYEGNEGWDNWCFCIASGHAGGWVPEQLIERRAESDHGVAKEDYSAKELDVNEGDEFQAIKALNGWLWCRRLTDNDIGWVPMNILRKIA